MWSSLIPTILLPDFTWPQPKIPLADHIPPTPRLTHPLIRRFWGYVYRRFLVHFGIRYAGWFSVPCDGQILPLPFGLILKRSDGTRHEEVLTTQMMRAAGLPAPLIICYGDHADTPHAPVSILMTRLPGKDMGQVYETLSDDEKDTILRELKYYLDGMRKWGNPWGDRICSTIGTGIRSIRIPFHFVQPCESEQKFNDYLIHDTSHLSTLSKQQFQALLAKAKEMRSMPHRIVFSHGDLQHHNLLVHEGHLSGFIDWEASGWYPDYWEYTTPMRFGGESSWWYQFVKKLGGSAYLSELECEKALTELTIGTYVW